MPRYRLTLEYDGTPFVGWQRQTNGRSVQQTLEEAAEKMSGSAATSVAAGRTDTGVHALGMVVHVDLVKDFPDDTVRDGLNALMRPWPIAVLAAQHVTEDFSARFSCIERQYKFRILSRRPPPAVDHNRVWHVVHKLDVSRMEEAAQYLIGKHDFTTFRSSQCQSNSPVKTLTSINFDQQKDEISIHFSAPSFLHNQIRSFVGTLERVGIGAWDPVDVKKALEAKDRSACGPVAPPDGLYFMKAVYPEQ